MPNLLYRHVATVLLLFTFLLWAETPPAFPAVKGATIQASTPSTIKVTTRIVVLDVVVTDKKGNPDP